MASVRYRGVWWVMRSTNVKENKNNNNETIKKIKIIVPHEYHKENK